jgi:Putative CRISPR-associated protein (Cas_VVA1548)
MLPKIDGLVMRRPNLIEAMYQLGLVSRDTPVLEGLTPEGAKGKVLLGPVPPRFARHALLVAEPIISVTEAERSGEFSVEEIIARFTGLSWFRVEDLGAPTEPAEIITSRHAGLNEYIRREGLARPDAPVEHHAQREHVEGKHAIGILPYRIGEFARLVTNVPTALPRHLQWAEITAEEQRAFITGDVFSYRVHRIETPAA